MRKKIKYKFILKLLVITVALMSSTITGIKSGSVNYKIESYTNDESWVSLDGSGEIIPPEINDLEYDHDGIHFDFELHGFFKEDVFVGNDTEYQKLSVQGARPATIAGMPEVPTLSYYFAVPRGADIEVVFSYNYITLDDYLVFPARDLVSDCYDCNDENDYFTINESFYSSDQYFPNVTVAFGNVLNLRGVDICRLVVCPIANDPVEKVLKCFNNIQIDVSFIGGTGHFYKPEKRSKYFEYLYQNFLINYPLLVENNSFNENMFSLQSDYDMLIITDDAFYDGIVPLATWRNLMGIRTEIMNISELPSDDPEDIWETVYDEYQDHNIDFLLLVGDVNFIPVFQSTFDHPDHDCPTGTDYLYSCVEQGTQNIGDDYTPDVHVGRISVETMDQLEIIVDKILLYEQNPPIDDTGWYDNILLATVEEYWDPENTQPRFFNTVNIAEDLFINYVTPSPDIFKIIEGMAYTASNAHDEVVRLMDEEGLIIASVRDHGCSSHDSACGSNSDEGWSHPYLLNSNISEFSNPNDRLCVMFNCVCDSGWFDGEVNSDTGSNADSMAETYLREEDVPVVGVLAASRASFSGYNEFLYLGLFDAIYQDIDPTYPNGNKMNPYGSSDVFEIGAILNYAKFAMIDGLWAVPGAPFTPNRDEFSLDMYHCFGDPSMQIRTKAPEQIDVDYFQTPGYYGDGSYYYFKGNDLVLHVTVNGNCIQGIRGGVCNLSSDFYKEDWTWLSPCIPQLYYSLTSAPEGYVNVTATKHNYIPFIDTIVIDRSKPVTTDLAIGEPRIKIGNDLWIGKNTNLKFIAEDKGSPPSGVARTEWSIDPPDWFAVDPSDDFTFADYNLAPHGLINLYYNSTDNVGNIENINTRQLLVDSEPPETTLEWKNDPHGYIIWINSTDPGPYKVGVSEIFYNLNYILGGQSGWKSSTTDITEIAAGYVKSIDYYAVDLVGNVESGKNTVPQSHPKINMVKLPFFNFLEYFQMLGKLLRAFLIN